MVIQTLNQGPGTARIVGSEKSCGLNAAVESVALISMAGSNLPDLLY
jgi:hypothetical protein